MTGPSPVMTVLCGSEMGFNCGIVGLPNVGKSALFNALTATQAAEATKYPFSTREANIGRVAVPDERLDACARPAKSGKNIPARSGCDRPYRARLGGRQHRPCRGFGRAPTSPRDGRDGVTSSGGPPTGGV